MTLTVPYIGELGAVGGILRPFDLTLERDGAVWDLSTYSAAQLRVWDVLTNTIVAINGTTTIPSPLTGTVRYTPGTSDPIQAASGLYEARVWCTPAAGGAKEPSALFRFSIGQGPGPS